VKSWLSWLGFRKLVLPQLARTMQSVRKRLAVPIHVIENATISLEQDVQEKFSKLFGQSGAGDGVGASEGGEASQC